jgi:dipeptidyl aminopeptidase/acylaminoacyl peptidase
MTKIRLLISLITILVVGTLVYLVSLYARGYRFNSQSLKFLPHGLLVVKSDPDSAQVYIDSELKTATNATIPIAPGTYDLSVKKEGYLTWSKRMTINKEEVTEVTAYLFKSAPSITSLTFSGVIQPKPSPDMTKIGYIVPLDPITKDQDKAGLWVLDTLDLPLGFVREPRRISDGDLTQFSFIWSPNSREILLTNKGGDYLLNVSDFTPQSKWVNISLQKDQTIQKWSEEDKLKLSSKMNKLPDELQSILERKAKTINFSPDEDMVLYTASGSASIPLNLIQPIPGVSTQKEDRDISEGKTYVYDIKEDKNFLIDENDKDLSTGTDSSNTTRKLTWFSTSRHLILAEPERIIIMDYDGTNRQEVFRGSYTSPEAFSTLSHNRLLIVTNLGASSILPNLYSLSLK